MIYELKEKKDKVVEEIYNRAMKELNDFYGVGWIRNTPQIIILKNRKQLDAMYGQKTEDWIVGFAKREEIYILDRNSYEKESSHKFSKKEYYSLIKHELGHLFFNIISKKYSKPYWLNEGTQIYVSDQFKKKKPVEDFKNFLNFYSETGRGVYQESGFAVKVLVENFGKDKLLELISSLKDNQSEKDFNKKFKEIYGQSPTYNFFNNLLRKPSQSNKKGRHFKNLNALVV